MIRDVKHPTRKAGNDQEVPLLGPAWDLLERTPKLDERVLPYNTESMCSGFERVRDRIAEIGLQRIGDLRFHDLRHTGITMPMIAGGSWDREASGGIEPPCFSLLVKPLTYG